MQPCINVNIYIYIYKRHGHELILFPWVFSSSSLISLFKASLSASPVGLNLLILTMTFVRPSATAFSKQQKIRRRGSSQGAPMLELWSLLVKLWASTYLLDRSRSSALVRVLIMSLFCVQNDRAFPDTQTVIELTDCGVKALRYVSKYNCVSF